MWGRARLLYHYHKIRYQRWLQNLSLIRNFSKIKLQRLLRYASQEIPYYANLDLRQLDTAPILDKSILQDNFKKLNSMGFSYEDTLLLSKNQPSRFNIKQSLGTSGVEGLFISSNAESIKALGILLKKILLPNKIPSKVALFYLSPEPYFAHSHMTKKLEWHYLNLRHNFEKLCIELKSFSPDVLIAPVQTLCRLAELQQENKICLSLKKIIATAEVLTPLEEKKIKASFNQPVHQLYQCAEGWLGATCEYGTLHLNESSFHIEKEWVDKDNLRFIPVITALDRYVQPLIRYRMEDILVLKTKPCPCGDPSIAIERFSGRCEDVLYFSKKFNHQSLIPIYSDSIHHYLEQGGTEIVKYQIIQYSPHHIAIKLHAKNFSLSKALLEEQFLHLCEKYQVKCPSITFVAFDTPPLHRMFRQTMRQAVNISQ